MNLQSFEGKNVRLTDVEGKVFEGYAADYIFADDNEPEQVESIVLNHSVRDDGFKYKNPIEFIAPEIKNIEVIS